MSLLTLWCRLPGIWSSPPCLPPLLIRRGLSSPWSSKVFSFCGVEVQVVMGTPLSQVSNLEPCYQSYYGGDVYKLEGPVHPHLHKQNLVHGYYIWASRKWLWKQNSSTPFLFLFLSLCCCFGLYHNIIFPNRTGRRENITFSVITVEYVFSFAIYRGMSQLSSVSCEKESLWVLVSASSSSYWYYT